MNQPPDSNRKEKGIASYRKPVTERLDNRLFNLLLAGGISAGGLGGFYWLFFERDIPKAITSVFIGLLISYSSSLLQPIHRGNQRRLERVGEAIDSAIDQVIVNLVRLEEQYLRCQLYDIQVYQIEGFGQHDGIFRPLLREVFVPLALDGNFPSYSLQSLGNREELNIWQFLSQSSRVSAFRTIAILAWGGYGKTILLRYITYIYCTNQQRKYNVPKLIPVLLTLREYGHLLTQDSPPNLPDLIVNHHTSRLPGGDNLNIPVSWFNDILQQGKGLILLDGFDELPESQRPVVAKWLNKQMRQFSKSIFIVTSRPKAYKEDAAGQLELSTTLWIRSFNKKQQHDFVTQWYLSQEIYTHRGRNTPEIKQIARESAHNLLNQIEARQELKDLARNPLLLNIITTLHRQYPGTKLPQRRVDLYQEICLLQLQNRPMAREIGSLLTTIDSQTILQILSLEMMQQRRQRIERASLLVLLDKHLKYQDKNIAPKEFLAQLIGISELLIEREFGEYEFAHLSFQEYFAAKQIAQQTQESLLYDHLKDDWWKSTIILYAGLVNPTNLIREATRQEAGDLAYQCYRENTQYAESSFNTTELRDFRILVQELLAPIPNPYVVGSPVTGNLFVGRSDIMRRLKELWSTSNQIPSIILCGHRRMGKTSILRNLSEHFCEDLIVDFNMQRVGYVSSTGELLYNLSISLYDELSKPQQQQLGEPLETDFSDRNPITSFDRFLKRLEPFCQGQRIIVTIDEFEIIEALIKEKHIEPRLLDFWRSLIHTYSWFVMVFAGLHTLSEMTQDYWHPLFASVQVIPVSFLEDKATEILVTNPSPDFNLTYTPEAISLIYKLTHGQPYLVQLICHNLITYFNRQRFEGIYRKSPLTEQDVEVVIQMPEFYRDGNAYFNGVWEQAKEVHEHEQIQILQALSNRKFTASELVQETGFSSIKIHKALQALEQHDVIQKQGDSYNYRVELMRRWVKRQPANNSLGAD